MVEELVRLKKSFSHAFDGLAYAIRRERNFRIELLVGVVVLGMIFVLKVKNWEAILLILMIMWVLILELINTVLERIVDMLKPKVHPYSKLIKDVMAAVVLISAFVAVIVGIIIFYPYARSVATQLLAG